MEKYVLDKKSIVTRDLPRILTEHGGVTVSATRDSLYNKDTSFDCYEFPGGGVVLVEDSEGSNSLYVSVLGFPMGLTYSEIREDLLRMG